MSANDVGTVENIEAKEAKINETAGKWLGIIGIVCGVIGFFWMRFLFGIVAVVLGVVGVFSKQKTINIISIVAGAVAIILGIAL